MRNKKIEIVILIIIILSLVGIGIAFAAFSQTLTINGTGTVESSSWSVVFEGLTNPNTIDAPTLVGTAAEVTHPTIKNDSTEISNYEVTLKSPGDMVIYNFKIHNKGDYAANLTSLTVAGVNRPAIPIGSSSLVTDSSVASSNYFPLLSIKYSFYYTEDDTLVGQNSWRDCLEPGESVNVSLKIIFTGIDPYHSTAEIGTAALPKTDLVLDNLGVSATYTQSNNGSCATEMINNYTGNFINIDYAYYTYEGKTFKGTSVDNVIISDSSAGKAKYTSKFVDNGAGADPRYTPTDHPALDMAEAYCTGCRLMTYSEAVSWGCDSSIPSGTYGGKCSEYNKTYYYWYLAHDNKMHTITSSALNNSNITTSSGSFVGDVRPAVSIPAGATMTGSGTQQDPYVISTN